MEIDDKPGGTKGGQAERDDESRKDELVKALNEAEGTYAPLQNKAQEVVELARQQRDLAITVKQAVLGVAGDEVFHTPEWTRVMVAWQQQNEEARKAQTHLFDVYETLVARTSSTAVSTSTAVVSTFLLPSAQMLHNVEQRAAAEEIDALLGRRVSIDQLRRAFLVFRLDARRGGNRSPLDLLNDADLALRRPPREEPSPSSVLIPLREAILRVVDELLKRVPQQPTHGIEGKLRLIGNCCKRSKYTAGFFENLGADGRTKLDTLSSAGKDRSISRRELIFLFDDGVLFLKALLDSLDPNRFRKQGDSTGG